jgi:hypothetical protein
MECYECDKDMAGQHWYTRRRDNGDEVLLCAVCDSVTPQYVVAGDTRIPSFE